VLDYLSGKRADLQGFDVNAPAPTPVLLANLLPPSAERVEPETKRPRMEER
jgi:hypothetical protein